MEEVMRFDPINPGFRLDRTAIQKQDVWVSFTRMSLFCSQLFLGGIIASSIASVLYNVFQNVLYETQIMEESLYKSSCKKDPRVKDLGILFL
jgi:hypothetical protein